jgi:ADP-ribose pyrophosphatase YjhB (NUDIX family)
LHVATIIKVNMNKTFPAPENKNHPMPFTRVELVVMSIVDDGLAVLLGKREQAPYNGQWALPGGVVRIDLDVDLAESAKRVALERLGIEVPYLRQQCVVGGASRDPRAPWAISIVYRALTRYEEFNPTAGKRLEALRWCQIEEAMADGTLAFDHNELIQKAVAATRAEIDRLELPFDYLPDQFTLGELQSTCESLLGRRLDKSSFRRRIDERNFIEPIPGEMRVGAFRPAQLYRRSKESINYPKDAELTGG